MLSDEANAYHEADLERKLLAGCINRIEYQVNEINSAMTGITILAVIAIALLAYIAWRLPG